MADFFNGFGTSVDDSHNVFQIVAAEIVSAPPTKGLQLGREKIGSGDEPDFMFTDLSSLRIFEGGMIPAGAEAQD